MSYTLLGDMLCVFFASHHHIRFRSCDVPVGANVRKTTRRGGQFYGIYADEEIRVRLQIYTIVDRVRCVRFEESMTLLFVDAGFKNLRSIAMEIRTPGFVCVCVVCATGA